MIPPSLLKLEYIEKLKHVEEGRGNLKRFEIRNGRKESLLSSMS